MPEVVNSLVWRKLPERRVQLRQFFLSFFLSLTSGVAFYLFFLSSVPP